MLDEVKMKASTVLPRSDVPSIRSTRHTALLVVIVMLLLALAGYFGLGAYVADRISTAERHPVVEVPTTFGLAYEPVRFSSTVDKVPLDGWYLDSPGTNAIMMLHGWNGNRSEGDTAMPVAKALVDHDYDVLMFDFRGHGESGAARMSLGQYETRDVAGALEYLRGRGVNQVGVIGWSLGANTAINSAPDLPEMRAIVADSVWAELEPVLARKFTYYTGLPQIFIPAVTSSGKVLYGIDVQSNRPARALSVIGERPVLLIHGEQDDFIPVSNAYLLQKAAADNPNFSLWVVPGADHTRAYHEQPGEFIRRMLGFYDRYLD
jgi:pimeloyl-ACP methyl ester carboxylesterase